MRNASTEFRRLLKKDTKLYAERVVITLANGKSLTLTNDNLWKGGFSFEDAVSSDNSFDVGAAIINSFSFTINNLYGDYDEYDFAEARVVVSVGLKLSTGTEYIQKGVFTVDETSYNGSTIKLKCLDNMSKFDRTWDSSLSFPATIAEIVRNACTVCGVSLASSSFPHSTYRIPKKPDGDTLTYREIVSYCAQIAGCYARCDYRGYLEFGWYDQNLIKDAPELKERLSDIANYIFKDYANYTWDSLIKSSYVNASGLTENNTHFVDAIFSHEVSTDDVVITGVQVEYEEDGEEGHGSTQATYMTGTKGYVVGIEGNKLIQNADMAKTVGDWLGAQLVGFRFRKASFRHTTDPLMEAGDVGFLVDRNSHVYRVIISSTHFSPGAQQSTTSSAETPGKNTAERYSAETKNYVRVQKLLDRNIDFYENGLKELQKALDGKEGLYSTIDKDSNGASIYYLHDKLELKDSKIIWKMNAEAWGVSTDGGKTWNGGMTINGDVIARYLNADGVNANWVRTGKISSKNGSTYFDLDQNELCMRSGSIQLGSMSTNYYFAVDTNGEFQWKSANSQMESDGTLTIRNATFTGASRFGYHPVIGNGKISLTDDEEGLDSISLENGEIRLSGLDSKFLGYVRVRDSLRYTNRFGLQIGDGDGNSIVFDTSNLYQYDGSSYKKLLVQGDVDLTQYATQSWVQNQGYLKAHQSLSAYATREWVDDEFVTFVELNNNYASKSYKPTYNAIQEAKSLAKWTGMLAHKINWGGSFTSDGALDMTNAPISTNNPYWGKFGAETSDIEVLVPVSISSSGAVTKWTTLHVITVNGIVQHMSAGDDNTGAISNWKINKRNERFPIPS